MARFKIPSPFIIFVSGALLALLIFSATLFFMNAPQCPSNFDQAETDTLNCITGANIGLGLGILLAAGIWAATIAGTLIVYAKQISGRKNMGKNEKFIQFTIVSLMLTSTAYVIATLLYEFALTAIQIN
jgi:hypothetical protein